MFLCRASEYKNYQHFYDEKYSKQPFLFKTILEMFFNVVTSFYKIYQNAIPA